MSTIAISFQLQALDGGQSFRGAVTVMYNDGNRNIPLVLNLTTGASTSGYFQEIPWQSGLDLDAQQAQSYVAAFNRDFRNVNGTKNLGAKVIDNVVTITSEKGTFVDGQSNYSGDILVVGGFGVINTPDAPSLVLNIDNPVVGLGCTTINYSFEASGGNAPYTLNVEGVDIITDWDGTLYNSRLTRANLSTEAILTDADGTILSSQIIIPRNLKTGEFKQRLTAYVDSADVLIENVNPVNGTEPIEYSLEAQGETVGANYQTNNVFQTVLPGTYELFIRDKFQCVITKTIIVSALEDLTQSQSTYFDIMAANSVIFAPETTFDSETKKNITNTLSYNEQVENSYPISQVFAPTDFEGIQFKSSYPYHVITLHKCDGNTIGLQPILIQENIGAQERVDCKIFPINGKTGVYFDGGNLYEPDTDTVIDASEYVQFTPSWAEEGQIVSIQGLGSFYITGTGYREDIARGYFVVDFVTTVEADAIVQVIRNIHDYNVFEFYIPFNRFEKGYISVERGLDFENIQEGTWVSETLLVREDNERALLIEWSSIINAGDIVYQSGIEMKKRIPYGLDLFRPYWDGESETSDGDSKVYGLRHTSYDRYTLELEDLTAREVKQMVVATGLEGFKINNLELERLEYPEITPLKGTNLYSLKGLFGWGGDSLAEKEDEIILNPSTGNEDGGGTGKSGTDEVLHDNRVRINVGGFLTVEGEFITI